LTAAAEAWIPYFVGLFAACGILIHWLVEGWDHRRRLRRIPIRVHVNGIRGKSTVVRYIAGALCKGGLKTLAKTSGSATRLILPDGGEQPIKRPGAPTILEQISVLRQHANLKPQAIVFECMAVRPDYQRIAEHKIMRSTLGVVLNVRRDHVEQLGHSLDRIARSLSETMPADGPVLTCERNEEALTALRDEARRRGVNLVEIDPDRVTDDEMRRLGPFAFRENVSAALAVSMASGVPRQTAIDGMAEAEDDPGASRAFELARNGTTIHWVDLFGINDPQSVEENVLKYLDWVAGDPVLIALLNNRTDREDRARDFADWIADTSRFRAFILTGEQRSAIAGRLEENGVEPDAIHEIDVTAQDDVDRVLETAAKAADGGAVAIVGMANIHTGAADLLRDSLESGDGVKRLGAGQNAAD
jgi:poly-gamma-glutamate synthase PgsB/CapB